MNLECRHFLNQPLVKNDLEPSRFIATIQLSQKQWARRLDEIRKKPEVQQLRSVANRLVPRVKLSDVLCRHVFLGMPEDFGLDFFECVVGEVKNGILKRLVEDRQTGEFIDLLLFDRVWRNGNDLAATNEDRSCHLFPYGFEESNETEIQRNRQRITPNRTVAHVEDLCLV